MVTAGLAEIAAGAISMGLGGYLAARSDAEHYASERRREVTEVKEIPQEERKEVRDVFRSFGLTDAEIVPILNSLEKRPKDWVDFMMRFELNMERPEPKRAWTSAVTIGGSYAVAGIIPLAPYMVAHEPNVGLMLSVALTSIALLVFGYIKGRFTGVRPFRTAIQTLVVGACAASVAFAFAKLLAPHQ